MRRRQQYSPILCVIPFSNCVYHNLTKGTKIIPSSTYNTEIPERFQSKALRMIVDAPRYVPNTVIRRDLQTSTVTEEIRRYSSRYSTRLNAHPNGLAVNLIVLPRQQAIAKTPAK
jgi:hypothetical protein